MEYVFNILDYLGITYFLYLSIKSYVEELKLAKTGYLQKKKYLQLMRDSSVFNSKNSILKQKRNREKLKMVWKSLKKTFGKLSIKLISTAELIRNGIKIRVTT